MEEISNFVTALFQFTLLPEGGTTSLNIEHLIAVIIEACVCMCVLCMYLYVSHRSGMAVTCKCTTLSIRPCL